MKSISILSLIPLIFIPSLTAVELKKTTTSTNLEDLISKACEKSSEKPLCLSVLYADPTAKTADLKSLAFIAVKTAAETATNTSTHIKTLLEKGSRDPEDDLSTCVESYVNVVDQLRDSMDSLATKNYKNVKVWISAAMADVSECHGNVKNHVKELEEMNHHVKDLCKNALEVVHVLAGHQA